MKSKLVCLSVSLAVVLAIVGNDVAASAAARVYSHGGGGSTATKAGGSVVAKSTNRITKVLDSHRLSDCGPMYQADLACGGNVAVKGPPNASLDGVSRHKNRTTFKFDDGSRVHATKRKDGSVIVDHDR